MPDALPREARIRHMAFTHTHGNGFGHHYVTQDKSLATAAQFDVIVFPTGDVNRRLDDPMRDTPHILIRTFDGKDWHVASITPIGKD